MCILLQNAVDKTQTLEVVVNQHILILVFEVVGNQVLVYFQAFGEWVVGLAQVGFHEILGGQPPSIGFAFHVVGIGLFLIVVGHTMEHKLEQ